MVDIQSIIKNNFSFILEKGFTYSYTYEKGSDSSCVYIHRFKRNHDYFDFRTLSGTNEDTSFVVYSSGEYYFPNLKKRHRKLYSSFKWKHLFKSPTIEEHWNLVASVIKAEILLHGDLFGIKI